VITKVITFEQAVEKVGNRWWLVERGCDCVSSYYAQIAEWDVEIHHASRGRGSTPTEALICACVTHGIMSINHARVALSHLVVAA
jgi:hypothetical protein